MKIATTIAYYLEPLLPAKLIAKLCIKTITKRNNLITDQTVGKKTILALNPGRFRGELELIEKSETFQVIRMPFDWQCFLFSRFYGYLDKALGQKYLPQSDLGALADAAPNQKKLLKIIQSILEQLDRTYGIHSVIAAGIHYRQDYEFLKVAKKLNFSAITLQRESNVASQSAIKIFSDKALLYKKFHGTHIFFHNHLQRDLFVTAGYIQKKETIVTGIPRMDYLVQNLDANCKKEKLITLFSFGPSTGIMAGSPPNWPLDPENFLLEFCTDVHKVMYELAENYPDWNFVIKPKWGGQWPKDITKLVNSHLPQPENLSIRPDADVHDLIAKSTAVIGFNSTTLIEAALTNRNTFLPLFAEASEDQWNDFIMYKDETEIFLSPKSKLELYNKLESIITSAPPTQLSAKELEKRQALFDRYAYASDGYATDRMLQSLENINDT